MTFYLLCQSIFIGAFRLFTFKVIIDMSALKSAIFLFVVYLFSVALVSVFPFFLSCDYLNFLHIPCWFHFIVFFSVSLCVVFIVATVVIITVHYTNIYPFQVKCGKFTPCKTPLPFPIFKYCLEHEVLFLLQSSNMIYKLTRNRMVYCIYPYFCAFHCSFPSPDAPSFILLSFCLQNFL